MFWLSVLRLTFYLLFVVPTFVLSLSIQVVERIAGSGGLDD
jgi:hypothetical protein